MEKGELVKLLHHLHGQLGLAIYRTIDDEWHRDSENLRTKINEAVRWLEQHQEVGDAYARGYKDGQSDTAKMLIKVADEVRSRNAGTP